MNEMNDIGGEFHWLGIPQGPFWPWPEPKKFFSLGRVIVSQIWQQCLPTQENRCLWLPSYFCPDTARYWQSKGIKTCRYLDHPLIPHPKWDTLLPARGDVVLAVNFFGVRSGIFWGNWQESHPDATLIEDHTHDPFSIWARTSRSDYAFASLRKTLPIPDGTIVWSPRKLALPSEPASANWTGSALKLAGMLWKTEYLSSQGTGARVKEIFRRFQIEGEEQLKHNPEQEIAPWSYALLEKGYAQSWRQKREQNVRWLITHIPKTEYIKPLFSDWPEGNCPFNLIVIANIPELRDELREYLIVSKIYPPIHWQLAEDADVTALDLSRRIMTIPADHRYNYQDLIRIKTALADFLKTNGL
jgi:hypothetical protein